MVFHKIISPFLFENNKSNFLIIGNVGGKAKINQFRIQFFINQNIF